MTLCFFGNPMMDFSGNPMTVNMSKDEISELLACALNKSGWIAPGRSRLPTCRAMARAGLLLASASGERFRLTADGRAVVLALNPDDFTGNRFWPLPGDVQEAQRRLLLG